MTDHFLEPPNEQLKLTLDLGFRLACAKPQAQPQAQLSIVLGGVESVFRN